MSRSETFYPKTKIVVSKISSKFLVKGKRYYCKSEYLVSDGTLLLVVHDDSKYSNMYYPSDFDVIGEAEDD